MKSWEKRAKEGPRAYQAFQVYLDMGPERSIKGVAAATNLSEARIRSWSRLHEWVMRAGDWEAYLAEAQQKQAKKILEDKSVMWAKRRVDLREQEYSLAEKLIVRANEILEMPLTEEIVKGTRKIVVGDEEVEVDTVTIIRPIKVTFRDAATMGEIASRMLRLSADMETSRSKVDVSITTDSERLEKAKQALEKIRDQMFTMLRTERPELSSEEVMNELVLWVAEDWHVKPELLTAGERHREPGETPSDETPPETGGVIEGVIVMADSPEEEATIQ